MEEQPDRDTIIDEAIGQTHGTEPPSYSVKREGMSPEEAARRLAPAPGAQASIPEKTAASLGERVGDAYADSGSFRQNQHENVGRPTATQTGSQKVTDRVLSTGQQLARSVSEQFSDQRFVSLIAAFGLGFMIAVLLRGRR